MAERVDHAPDVEFVFRAVLCGVDGSAERLEAVRQALLVGADGAKYWSLSAWDPGVTARARLSGPELAEQLREESRSALRRAHEAFPAVEPILMRGRDVALLAGIANLEADLVCVGSHGTSRPAGVLFGSVASAMAHFAPCSVLAARKPQAGEFPGLLIHASDGSPESLDAARVAGGLAARHGSTVVTLHVGEPPDHSVAEEAMAIMESCGREPVMKVEQGSPHRKIIEAANETSASLIVMGSRGRTGLAALGSVSERVAHSADCSVLIVRRTAHPVPRDVARFAVPAGTLVGVGVLGSYLFALHPLRLPLIEARTVAITVLIVLGLYLIIVLEATGLRRRTVVSVAVTALAALYLAALATPPVRSFFELASPDAGIAATAICGSLLSLFALHLSGFTPGAAASLSPPQPTPTSPRGAETAGRRLAGWALAQDHGPCDEIAPLER